MIAPPIAPHLSPQLDIWPEEPEHVLELQDVAIRSADLSEVKELTLDNGVIEDTNMASVRFERFGLTDCSVLRLEGAAMQAYKPELLRVVIRDSRLTGVDFPEGNFEDCIFRNLKLDGAGFRFARFKRVRFENCILRQADFSSAKLTNVSFTDCDLDATNFQSAVCAAVDITGEDLSACKGILELKGATISNEQLIQIAPFLAAELGFRVGS